MCVCISPGQALSGVSDQGEARCVKRRLSTETNVEKSPQGDQGSRKRVAGFDLSHPWRRKAGRGDTNSCEYLSCRREWEEG